MPIVDGSRRRTTTRGGPDRLECGCIGGHRDRPRRRPIDHLRRNLLLCSREPWSNSGSHGQTPQKPWSKRELTEIAMVNSRLRACFFRISMSPRFPAGSGSYRQYPPVAGLNPAIPAGFFPDFDSGAGIEEKPASVFENPGQKPDQWPGAMVISTRAMVISHQAMGSVRLGTMVNPIRAMVRPRGSVFSNVTERTLAS